MSARDYRQVHATLHGRWEIVRYNRSGKWYSERPGSKPAYRRHIGIAEAARLALQCENAGGEVRLNLPGGQMFDKRVRDLRAAGETA